MVIYSAPRVSATHHPHRQCHITALAVMVIYSAMPRRQCSAPHPCHICGTRVPPPSMHLPDPPNARAGTPTSATINHPRSSTAHIHPCPCVLTHIHSSLRIPIHVLRLRHSHIIPRPCRPSAPAMRLSRIPLPVFRVLSRAVHHSPCTIYSGHLPPDSCSVPHAACPSTVGHTVTIYTGAFSVHLQWTPVLTHDCRPARSGYHLRWCTLQAFRICMGVRHVPIYSGHREQGRVPSTVDTRVPSTVVHVTLAISRVVCYNQGYSRGHARHPGSFPGKPAPTPCAPY